MPIYEYRCGECGHELEALQQLSDPALTGCPECGEEALARLVSAAGFRLKGGGWYETDFKTGKKRNVAEGNKASSGDGKKSDGGDTKKTSGGCSGACKAAAGAA